MRWAEARIGRQRSAISYNFRSFVDAGARIAFGTDWFVEPLDPMLGLYAAVTRQFPDGTPAGGWFPDERITMEQAVEYYTLGSAYAEFAEERKGTITEGKLADLVILSRDIFTIPPREILDTRPTLTMVGVLIGGLLSGAVVTETVFSRLGIGRLVVTAVNNRDVPVVQVVVVFAAVVFVVANLLVDLVYPLIDRRITLARTAFVAA